MGASREVYPRQDVGIPKPEVAVLERSEIENHIWIGSKVIVGTPYHDMTGQKKRRKNNEGKQEVKENGRAKVYLLGKIFKPLQGEEKIFYQKYF